MRRIIPNTLTLINMLCGCCALVCVFQQRFELVPLFISLALLADFGDGLMARLLGVHSELGKQLDSLADMVSFGVVPGAIIFNLLLIVNEGRFDSTLLITMIAIPGFLLSAFSGLRLAKFNIDTRQSERFIGLATPASTIFVLGILMVFDNNAMGLRDTAFSTWMLYAITFVLSYLLVAEIPMFSFKFKHLRWTDNEIRIIFSLSVLLLLILFKVVAIPLAIVLYVLFSVLDNRVLSNRKLKP